MKVYPPPGLFQMQLLIVTLIITIKNHISTTINNDLKKKKKLCLKEFGPNLDLPQVNFNDPGLIGPGKRGYMFILRHKLLEEQ